MLPSVPTAVAPTAPHPLRRPDAPTPATEQQRAVTTFEHLSREVQQLITEVGLRRNGHEQTLDVDATQVFSGLNQELRDTFSDQRPALLAMRALEAARDDAGWQTAWTRLAEVPKQCRDLCVDSVWSAVTRLAPKWTNEQLEQTLAKLLGLDCATFRPVEGAVLPSRPWLRALRLLLERETSPSPTIVAGLLRLAEAQGPIPAKTWRRLMEHVARAASRWPAPDPAFTELPGLDERQVEELTAIVDCAALAGETLEPDELGALVERVQHETSPPCRHIALDLLLRCHVPPGCHRPPALLEAVGRLPAAELERALRTLAGIGSKLHAHEFVVTHLDRMPPSTAMRFIDLKRDSSFLQIECGGSPTNPPIIHPLLDRARSDPGELRRTLEVMADRSRAEPTGILRYRLAAVAMRESAGLPPEDRIAVLARIPFASVDGWVPAWEETLRQAPLPDTNAGLLGRVRALTAGPALPANLPCRLGELYAPLAALPPQQRAVALETVAHMCANAQQMPLSNAHWLRLIDLCESLPFHLRRRPLDALQANAARRVRGAPPQLQALEDATDAARRGWLAEQV
ncbi:hypothetical protein [Xylophilus sp. GOD-11R]|uniref:hypothetical protein n=1 Tax=Xylophilus sp. GOD-11R TaxID=3089814 RepID=UPI00298CA36C|nr:hypothetical protein [Xylophilus sp. GOD-11R]WPB56752.1 hypothetical protein R9X41_21865 [Xylophilus sp. GOD-11R]